MGIVLAVQKKGRICIAADSMTVSGGSRKQTPAHVLNTDKIVKWGNSYIGHASHAAWPLVLKSYFKGKKAPLLRSKEEVFDELLKFHGALKENYFLMGEEEGPFESSRFESLIVNPEGIFKTYELRSVQHFIQFSAIGSGAEYALGALHCLYDKLDSAEEIAQRVLDVVTEFDDSSGLPGTFYTMDAK